MRKCAHLLLLLLVCYSALATEPQESTEEKIGDYTRFRYERSKVVTLNPFPVELNKVQISADYLYTTSRYRWTNSWNRVSRPSLTQHVGTVLVVYGWSDIADIGLSMGYSDIADAGSQPRSGRGLTDLALSSAVLIYSDTQAPAFAIGYIGEISFPTGTQSSLNNLATSSEFFTFDNRFSITQDFHDYWTSNYDFGFTWFFGDKARESYGVFSAHAAIAHPVLYWLYPTLEFGYTREITKSGPDKERFSIISGVVLPLSEVTRLTFGVEQDFIGRNTDEFTNIIANASFTF